MLKHWSYLLVFCFAFLAVPKEYIHDHDHHELKNEQHDVSFEEDCFVCDINYADLAGDFSITPGLFSEFAEVYLSTRSYIINVVEQHSIPLRGPPIFS